MENQKMAVRFDNELYHHGVSGQKHGLRRYQYPDGSLTPEGRRHWGVGPPREKRKSFRLESKEDREKRLELKRQKKEAKEAKKAERLTNKKIKMINRGNREEIYKNRKLFSDDELKYIDSRLNLTEKFGKNEPKQTYEEKRKQDILNSGDLDKIYKNQKLFTNQELKDAVSRAESLKKLNPEEQKKQTDNAKNSAKNGKSMSDSLLNAANTASKILSTGVAIYGNYNKIAAAINEIKGDTVLPTYGNTPWSNPPQNPHTTYNLGTSGSPSATINAQLGTYGHGNRSHTSTTALQSPSNDLTSALSSITIGSGNNYAAQPVVAMNNALANGSTITIQDLMNNP